MATAVPAGDRDGDRDPPSTTAMGAPTTPPARDGDAPRDPGSRDLPPDVPPEPDNGGARPADPPEQPVDPDVPGVERIQRALLGHWWAFGGIGNCIELRDWYSFEPEGRVINRGVDHNACSGARLMSEATGRYHFDGRTLQIWLEGPGSDTLRDMPSLVVDADRFEKLTVAIGERPATATLPAEMYLDGTAFRSSNGQDFESERSTSLSGTADDVLFHQNVKVGLRLEPGLPAAIGDVVTVRVRVELSRFDRATDSADLSDTFELDYPAVIRDAPVWRPIVPTALDGLSNEDAIEAWNDLLAGAGIAAHPEWAQRLLHASIYPSQRYNPDDPMLLTSTLPEHGRWTRSADPPPVPTVAP